MNAYWMMLAAALLAMPLPAAAQKSAGPSKAAQQLVKTVYPSDASLITDIEIGTLGAPVTGPKSASPDSIASSREAIGALVGCQMSEAGAKQADKTIEQYTALSRVRSALAQYYDREYTPAELQQLQRFLATGAGKKFLTNRTELAGKASLATQNQALEALKDAPQLCKR